MFQPEKETDNTDQLRRITALWALTEISLGGMMHALRIPLSGLFVGGTALLCLFLITRHSRRPVVLFQSLAIVAGLKALGSPHSSPFAYVAMALQTACCLPLMRRLGSSKLAVAVFMTLAMLYSSVQRLLILWITLGTAGATAVIQWAEGLAASTGLPETSLAWAIVVYVIGYLFASVLVVSLAWRWMDGLPKDDELYQAWSSWAQPRLDSSKSAPKKRSRGAISIILLFGFATGLFFAQPDGWVNLLLRPLLIVLLWLIVIRPLFSKWIIRRAGGRRDAQTRAVENEIEHFPPLRPLLEFCWKESGSLPWWRRPSRFIGNLFAILMYPGLEHG